MEAQNNNKNSNNKTWNNLYTIKVDALRLASMFSAKWKRNRWAGAWWWTANCFLLTQHQSMLWSSNDKEKYTNKNWLIISSEVCNLTGRVHLSRGCTSLVSTLTVALWHWPWLAELCFHRQSSGSGRIDDTHSSYHHLKVCTSFR